MTGVDLRELERESIRAFVASHEFAGNVLDYGAGVQPYRDLVERSAVYVPFDAARFPASTVSEDSLLRFPFETMWEAILCTQVVQYVSDVYALLRRFVHALTEGGALVLTYPTCWPIVEAEDLWRFTPNGIARLVTSAGFAVERNEIRGEIVAEGEHFPLGGGLVARA